MESHEKFGIALRWFLIGAALTLSIVAYTNVH